MDERKSVYAVVDDEQMTRVRSAMEDVTSLVSLQTPKESFSFDIRTITAKCLACGGRGAVHREG